MNMEPGPYTVFILKDDGTWVQPCYLVGEGWTELKFGNRVENDNGGFYHAGIMYDGDAPEENTKPLGDYA